jgi:SAM-dependent methyltransferase
LGASTRLYPAEAVDPQLMSILRCPATGQPLRTVGDLTLATEDGSRRYPVVGGVPVLIADERSVFRTADYTRAGRPDGPRRGVRALARRLVHAGPAISGNAAAGDNFRELARLLEDEPDGLGAGGRRRVLVVGGQREGAGFGELLASPAVETVDTDVAVGPRTQIVCDGHDLPFRDGEFDAVVAQAVLEHVADPPRVVSEVHRVLRPGGLVYSEVPFMQQVHEGAHDFTRYTHTGHRRLFRCFDEIRSGAVGGPGMALAWSVEYFLLSFTTSRAVRTVMRRAVSLALFWLKYVDAHLARLPGGLDAASGTFFLGRRRDTPIPDREIVDGFRGVR